MSKKHQQLFFKEHADNMFFTALLCQHKKPETKEEDDSHHESLGFFVGDKIKC